MPAAAPIMLMRTHGSSMSLLSMVISTHESNCQIHGHQYRPEQLPPHSRHAMHEVRCEQFAQVSRRTADRPALRLFARAREGKTGLRLSEATSERKIDGEGESWSNRRCGGAGEEKRAGGAKKQKEEGDLAVALATNDKDALSSRPSGVRVRITHALDQLSESEEISFPRHLFTPCARVHVKVRAVYGAQEGAEIWYM